MVPLGPCDDDCRKGYICAFRTARTEDDQLCKDLVDDIRAFQAERLRSNPC